MEEKTAILHGGFDQPVFDSQSVFRAVMDGMAEPGSIREIHSETHAPQPVGTAMSAVLLTLLDADTPVWLTPTLAETALKSWLSFHCGAAETEEKSSCAFAVIEKGATIPSFELFATGSQEYPDRSTTLVIELTAFEGGEIIVLSGPGIKGKRAIAPQGLPPHFMARWAGNRASFPRGIDIVFTCGSQLFCLPRSTTITHEGG